MRLILNTAKLIRALIADVNASELNAGIAFDLSKHDFRHKGFEKSSKK